MEDIFIENVGNNMAKKQPPAKSTQSLQHDLFSAFLGEQRDLSNTIELWDSIPKYFVSKQKQNKLRDDKGRLPVLEREFEYKKSPCKIVIQPAAIQQSDGSYKDFYPSAREELIEDVLRKIFTDQHYGLYDRKEGDSWVRFSLHMIKKEMKNRGKSLSTNEISESLDILSNSIMRLKIDGKLTYTNPILSDMITVTKEEYLNDRSVNWAVRLPSLISRSLEGLTYRQYNYALGMGLKSQLSRWFHKQLSHKYIYADLRTPYKILYSDIDRDSGLLNKARGVDNRKAIVSTLKELKSEKIILHYSEDKILGARSKVENVEYFLTAHPEFTSAMKAANKRLKDAKLSLNYT